MPSVQMLPRPLQLTAVCLTNKGNLAPRPGKQPVSPRISVWHRVSADGTAAGLPAPGASRGNIKYFTGILFLHFFYSFVAFLKCLVLIWQTPADVTSGCLLTGHPNFNTLTCSVSHSQTGVSFNPRSVLGICQAEGMPQTVCLMPTQRHHMDLNGDVHSQQTQCSTARL